MTRPTTPGGRGIGGRDAGTVTAETAVVLPALAMLLVVVVALGVAVQTRAGCQDAARSGARAAARGDPGAAVRDQALAVAPRGATVEVSGSGDTVTVTVVAPVWIPLGSGLVARGSSTAAVEVPPP